MSDNNLINNTNQLVTSFVEYITANTAHTPSPNVPDLGDANQDRVQSDDKMPNSVSPLRNVLRLKIDCAVCLESALEKTPTAVMCGHIFCRNCIRRALRRKKVCPVCQMRHSKLIKLFGLYP